ncbi:MAG: hypothetical protein ACRDHP_07680, partial [Ktedonobacterales bacterium]
VYFAREGGGIMAGADPHQVIVELLSAPSIVESDTPAGGVVGWRTRISSGGMDARPETFRFVKAREIPERQVHAVTYETVNGSRQTMVCSVRQSAGGGWEFVGGAGGGDGGDGNGPPTSQPKANLGGGGWPRAFYAGGRVEGGPDVARVALTAANGAVLDDTVEDGVVLFLTDDEVRPPLHVTLYDGSGNVIGQQEIWKS